MQVFEISVHGATDEQKEPIARLLCPDENHPPPCPVPWAFGYADDAVVLAIVADRAVARSVAQQVRALTALPVSVNEGSAADHETLLEQARIEHGHRT